MATADEDLDATELGAPVTAPTAEVVLPPAAVREVPAPPDAGDRGFGMPVAVVAADPAGTPGAEDADPVTAPAELVALSGHSVVVFVVVPTATVTVPPAEEAADAADEAVAVYVGVHSSAGRVKVPSWLPEPP